MSQSLVEQVEELIHSEQEIHKMHLENLKILREDGIKGDGIDPNILNEQYYREIDRLTTQIQTHHVRLSGLVKQLREL